MNNFEKLAALFPNAITETINENGELVRAVDFDILRQEFSEKVIEGRTQRYQFTWPDKNKSIALANQSTDKTLRPVYEKSCGRDGTPGCFDSQNIYIEGDNLDALKILRETYLHKVKMIYIDPPYNTGSDFIYNDKFSLTADEYDERYNGDGEFKQNLESSGRFHTDWLNMIYPRLKVARDLLSDDGFIAISIGEEESYNLRKVCNEIFGERNFRNIIATRRYDKNLNLQFASKGLVTMNVGLEYILVYSRDPGAKMKAVYRQTTEDRSAQGYWKGFWNSANRPTMRYELFGVTPEDGQWKWGAKIADEAVANYREYEQKYKGIMTLEEYWLKTGKTKKFLRRNPSGTGKNLGVEHWVAPSEGIMRNSNWSDMLISKPVGMGINFDNPKNLEVIMTLIELFNVGNNDIIIDFFSGSATTAHAVMSLNASYLPEAGKGRPDTACGTHSATGVGQRKFILVQLPEPVSEKSEAFKAGYATICDIGEERIRRAGKKLRDESPLTTSELDTGFRVFRVDSTNMKDVYKTPEEYEQRQLDLFAENIKPDRTPEDLLIQVMLELGIELSAKIEEKFIAGKKVFNVNDGLLTACFDYRINTETVTAIAQAKPSHAVFRDSCFESDSVITNIEQLFEAYSPKTRRRII